MSNTAQILRGAPATVTFTLLDQNGEPRSGGVVTVGVHRANGDEVLADVEASTTSNTGEIAIDLEPAQTSQLDHLVFTWDEDGGGTFESVVEVVGGYYFTLEEARNAGRNFDDTQKYPEDQLIAARRSVEEEADRITGRAFVPRHRRVVLNGTGSSELRLPHPNLRNVRALDALSSNNGVRAYDPEAFVVAASGLVTFPTELFPFGSQNITVEYEYGFDAPPQRIKEAALIRFRDVLSGSKIGVPDKAAYQVVEGKVFSVQQPGVRGSRTGIPEVDQAYDDWSLQRESVSSIQVH